MERTAVIYRSEKTESGQAPFDKLHFWFSAIHLGIVLYVALGWLITSRLGLYFYALLLPAIALQWLLNSGCSIVNNFENVVRVGSWNLPTKRRQSPFFKGILGAVGVRASQAQITTALCSLMLIFWICAICRMMLIVS